MEKRKGVCSCECGAHQNEIRALKAEVERLKAKFEATSKALIFGIDTKIEQGKHIQDLSSKLDIAREALAFVQRAFGTEMIPLRMRALKFVDDALARIAK